VDPCEDFYKYACGNFLKETVIPDQKTHVDVMVQMTDVLNERLRKQFEGSAEDGEPQVFEDVRNFYKSCMNESLINDNSRKDLMKIVNELGGWPILQGEKWSGEKFVWQKQEEAANRLGLDTGKLLHFGIGTNNDNSTQRILVFNQASLGLHREFLVKGLEDKVVKAYFKYMIDIAVYLGADKETAENELKESLELELKLAKITLPKEEQRNKTALNNQMTLGEASKLYPGYDWVDYANNQLNNQDIIVDKNEIVNVKVPKFMKDLKDLLSTVDNRVVANYMMWRYVKTMVPFLDANALAIMQDYSKVLSGQGEESSRWETCVKTITVYDTFFSVRSLNNAVGSMYAQKYFPEDKKVQVKEMVTNLIKEFKIMLDELEWMDSTTKVSAYAKIDQMTPHIAYSKEILDTDLINQFYKGLSLNSDSFITNNLKLNKFIQTHYWNELRQPIDKQSWKTHSGAAIVNAFYSPNENSIEFPAGILDGLYFQADRPAYMNYAGIGVAMGHEITHGFDDQGAQKDGQGNLVNWWPKETKQNYLEKAQCIIDQYGNYSVTVDGEKINLNGINTQGENIADNGGPKEAYRAYNRMTAKHGPEPRLPGLPHTPRQMFWLAGAQIYCSIQTSETEKIRILRDQHSPEQFRVNGAYSNLPEFAADWNCPAGSPMNPAKRCTVW